MRKRIAGIVLAGIVGGWSLGCTSSLSTGRVHWQVKTIPEGMAELEIDVPGIEVTASADLWLALGKLGELVNPVFGWFGLATDAPLADDGS